MQLSPLFWVFAILGHRVWTDHTVARPPRSPTMGLPPLHVLLAPPRRANDGTEWSKADGERYCLRGAPCSARASARRALSPLRFSSRNSAAHVPQCVMPRVTDDENGWRPTYPVPLSARTLGELAKETASRLRRQRLSLEAGEAASRQSYFRVRVEAAAPVVHCVERSITLGPRKPLLQKSARARHRSADLPPLLDLAHLQAPLPRRPSSAESPTRLKQHSMPPARPNSDRGTPESLSE